MVIAVTGGGSGAVSVLLQTPGASRSILEALIPYSLPALVEWIGGQPDQACSGATARAMAMAAFIRARALAPEIDPALLLGVGATASLASDRPKRGERRIHIALQSATRSWTGFCSLDELPAERPGDERAAAELLLSAIAGGCGIADARANLPVNQVGDGRDATAAETDLLLGARRRILLSHGAEQGCVAAASPDDLKVVFPGAFNPRHAGHLRMAEIAERRLKSPVVWELSITNVDKPPLDFIAIHERVEPLQFDEGDRLIALTRAATFREKAELFPGATFVVGADTIRRIAEPRYYGGDIGQRDAAIDDIASLACRFLVFGRELEGRFMVLSDLKLPLSLRALCDEVPASEFREDVSSMELRRRSGPRSLTGG
jgi:hypothetical protein